MNKTEWRLEIRRSSDGMLKGIDIIVDTQKGVLIEAEAQLIADFWNDDEHSEIAVINVQTEECYFQFGIIPPEPEETYLFEHRITHQRALAFGKTVEDAFDRIVDALDDKDPKSWDASTNEETE